MSVSGQCQCGAVTITAPDDPLTVRACWCRDCQKLSGGGATHNAFYRTDDVSWQGEVRWHDVIAASGNGLARGFCPACGTPLFVQSHIRRHLIAVRIGVFDDTDRLGPRELIWTATAPAWACLDPALPKTEGQPAPAAPPPARPAS